jgi:hypothetical protein
MRYWPHFLADRASVATPNTINSDRRSVRAGHRLTDSQSSKQHLGTRGPRRPEAPGPANLGADVQ